MVVLTHPPLVRVAPLWPSRVAGALLLAAASPVILLAALIVCVLSRRSPFVVHLRVGQYGAPLWVWKLRTMWSTGAPTVAESGLVQWIVAEPGRDRKDPRDPRVTSAFAAFCRRHSIDELPQLIQVMRGEMSLLGPRPVTQSELIRYYGPEADELLSVKPGITGLWQTRGRSNLDWPTRVALDLEMVRKQPLRSCLSIWMRTFAGVVKGEGAW